MKVIFMGTPDFAVGTLEAIVAAGHEVVLAVTQPDKPKGRGKSMQYPPVKEAAIAYGIEVYQPERVRQPRMHRISGKISAGHHCGSSLWTDTSKRNFRDAKIWLYQCPCTLLPKYRGAAPIQWAVINGEKASGVTIMRMDEGLDTGDMIASVAVELDAQETGGSLFDKLQDAGARLCVETMKSIEDGTAVYTPQDNEIATHTKMIQKSLGKINWSLSAVQIERLIVD